MQSHGLQFGLDPSGWKPLGSIGPGRPHRLAAVGADDKHEGRVMADKDEDAGEMRQEVFGCVWDALEDTPEEAVSLRLRSRLMMAVEREVQGWQVTQTAAAQRLGITQPRLSDLMRGKVNRFTLDALVDLAGRAGLAVRVEMTVRPNEGQQGGP